MEPVWQLDPQWTFLNHGSFGARLERVAAEQERWRRRLERQPLRLLDSTAGLEGAATGRTACGGASR